MEDNFTLITDKLPKKGKDVLGIDAEGGEYCCYRCACHNPNCTEWRCPIGGGLMINVIKWKYI